MREDLEIVADLIRPGARVLDLGCGEGELLDFLQTSKAVNGYGLDVDAANITQCLRKGVNVIEQDLDDGLGNFADQSFDMVVMTETLQSVKAPDKMVEEMLRIGAQCIVTFPNFGHWRCRIHLLLKGRMPVARHLPHNWYNTPNIHLCTFRDFEHLCAARRLKIVERRVVNRRQRRGPGRWWPNLFGTTAFYRLERG